MLMKAQVETPPRLVLYGIGNFGKYVARLADQKKWPIVAAFNRAGDKVGQDLGRVAGLDREIGVIIQDPETTRFEGLEADIGVVTMHDALRDNFPAYERLMRSGMNVLCLGGQAYYPKGNDPEMAEKIDALARRHGVSFTGGGIWDISRIWSGILALGTCTEINSLYHRSVTIISRQLTSVEQAQTLAVGFPEKEFWERGHDKAVLGQLYRTIAQQVLDAVGYHVTATHVRVEPVTFEVPIEFDLFPEPIPAGYCVGTRIVVDTETEEGVTAKSEIELRMARPGDVEHMMWRVDGRPQMTVTTERNDSMHASAAGLFNRIPDVIAAPPGIVPISQMGPPKHTALL